MPKTSEETGKAAAKLAGLILGGRATMNAELWLERLAAGETTTTAEDAQHAAQLITILAWARSVAASALTQKVK